MVPVSCANLSYGPYFGPGIRAQNGDRKTVPKWKLFCKPCQHVPSFCFIEAETHYRCTKAPTKPEEQQMCWRRQEAPASESAEWSDGFVSGLHFGRKRKTARAAPPTVSIHQMQRDLGPEKESQNGVVKLTRCVMRLSNPRTVCSRPNCRFLCKSLKGSAWSARGKL